MKKILFSLSIMVILLASSLAFIPVQSAFPGENGLIAFSSMRYGYSEIFTLDPNSPETTQRQLTNNVNVTDIMPAWSADGSKIAFTRFSNSSLPEVWIMNADGSGEEYLTDGWAPTWSPDGRQIAFTRALNIWVINIDGTDEYPLQLGNETLHFTPAWSPDGEAIAFASLIGDPAPLLSFIGVVEVDSGYWGPATFPELGEYDLLPDWSPDGSAIVFSRVKGLDDFDIWVIRADYPNEIPLLDSEEFWDFHAAWSPDGTKIVFSRMENQTIGTFSSLNTFEEMKGYLLGLESFATLQIGAPGIVVMDLESGELELLSDYGDHGPDWQPILPEPVGGEIAPITALALVPWIALIGAAIALGYTITRRKTTLH